MTSFMIIKILQWVVAGCMGFTAMCVAAGWLFKIIKGIKKPKDEIDKRFQRDYDRLNNMDLIIKEFKEQFQLIDEKLDRLEEMNEFLLENDIVGFEHMRTNNATGRIEKREHDLKVFLVHKKDPPPQG